MTMLDLGVSPVLHNQTKPQPISVGELVSLPGAVEITLLSGNASSLEILPDGVRAREPGRYRIQVSGGLRVVVAELVAVDASLMGLIHVDDTKLTAGESVEGRRLGVLRALAQEPRFDGSTFEGFNLTHYGADRPPSRGVVVRR